MNNHIPPDRSAGSCHCEPRWPRLAVALVDGDVVEVSPAATPGGLACLYRARCTGCGADYPGQFRVLPYAGAA